MASFAEELKKALAGATHDFLTARNGLVEEVEDASRHVEELTQGRVKLVLAVSNEDENSTIFSLNMLNNNVHQEITGFKIGLSGFPIISAASIQLRRTDSPPAPTIIKSREEIKQFLTQLASDRNSPLVRKLAFVLRQK